PASECQCARGRCCLSPGSRTPRRARDRTARRRPEVPVWCTGRATPPARSNMLSARRSLVLGRMKADGELIVLSRDHLRLLVQCESELSERRRPGRCALIPDPHAGSLGPSRFVDYVVATSAP